MDCARAEQVITCGRRTMLDIYERERVVVYLKTTLMHVSSSATDHYDRSSGALYTCWAYLYFVADL